MDKTCAEHLYALQMRPILNKSALYSDESGMFLSPSEPKSGDTVRIRFRTARNNVDHVKVVMTNGTVLPMIRKECRNGFDYYEAHFKIGEETVSYYFEIESGRMTCAYNRLGLAKELPDIYNFHCVPGFSTPDWAKGSVMYQIFVDRFCNGDPSNDVLTDEYSYIQQHVCQIDQWDTPVSGMDVRNFYGGDLQGIIDKLDYLQDLGIEALYLNPIFVSPSNHKYDIQDYDHVDPHFGKIVNDEGTLLESWDQNNMNASRYIRRVTGIENLEASNELFIHLVEEVHRRGMRIILDGVFNHCGSFNKWMDHERIYESNSAYEPGAFESANSPYRDYFKFGADQWPYNESYDGWWGHKTLPKLNYEGSQTLKEEIYRIGKKWVSEPYCVDGWRLDVAADLGHSEEYNHEFWRGFRREVKEANPEALIVAEHYGNSAKWLKGDQWDTVMNYDAFMEPVSWFLTGMEKHSDGYREDLLGNAQAFYDMMRYNMANFRFPTQLTAMNQLDNHDHSRFLTRTNHFVGRVEQFGSEAAERGVNPAVLREAVLFQMGWPGAPTLYYGDEAGVCGFTDPDNRRPFPWGKEDQELEEFYKKAIALHKKYPVLRTGSVHLIYQDQNILAFARFDYNEEVIFVINNRLDVADIEIPVWIAGMNRFDEQLMLERVFRSDRYGFDAESIEMDASGGMLKLIMQPQSAEVFYHSERSGKKSRTISGNRPITRGRRSASKWGDGRNRKNLQTMRK